MDVYWLAQTESDVPLGDEWLSRNERAVLGRLQVPKRRADWRLGRWTAKCAVSAYLRLSRDAASLATLEIHAALSGAPEALIDGRHAPLEISLSHSGGTGFCAVAPRGSEIGCDLEAVEPRSAAFLADYFTDAEQHWVSETPAAQRDQALTLLWSAKESTLKALGCGLRLDTRSVDSSTADLVQTDDERWHRICSVHRGKRAFHGWWRRAGDFIWTVVADPQPLLPRGLILPCNQTGSVSSGAT